MATMRAIEVSAPGFENIKLVERPIPEPGRGEVQIRIMASTLNFRDLAVVETGAMVAKMPFVPLSDACGVVSAIGKGVTRFKEGDRVAPMFFQNWESGSPPSESLVALGGPVDGTAREYACFSETAVAKVPDFLSDFEAAALPCAGLTAWNSLFAACGVKPGDMVLLQGTGGVSIAGLLFAKAAGATVIITSSLDAKLARAMSLGADHGINYRDTPEWGERAKSLTAGRGVDAVLEVGGTGTLEQSLAALRKGGDIAIIGRLTGNYAEVKDPEVTPHRIHVGSRELFEDMVRGVEANHIRPVIDRIYPLEKLADAMRLHKAGAMFSKVAIDLS